MLQTEQFGIILKKWGFSFYSGVPCSFLKDLINYAINDCNYVMAANEGDALAICAGATLAGKKTVVLMQNSGLGNAVSPLTSLNAIFKIPVLGFVSLRGEKGIPDEPQHELMGVITDTMLKTMHIDYDFLSTDMAEAEKQIGYANSVIENGKPFFFIVKKDTFAKIPLKKTIVDLPKELPSRASLIECTKKYCNQNTAFIATTGFTGRELYQITDACNNFYMVGSLGCASSIGLGISLAKPEQKIVIFDGDGSVLMRMGSLAVNASYSPQNFCHILLDNNAHESTGGQHTVSNIIDYPALAKACGYKTVVRIETLSDMEAAIKNWNNSGGMIFIYARIKQGTFENLIRPKVTPKEVNTRFSDFLKTT